ncbi:MAG: alpha/beta hydrolase [Candidatus Bilamarchaeaceae archaeon]
MKSRIYFLMSMLIVFLLLSGCINIPTNEKGVEKYEKQNNELKNEDTRAVNTQEQKIIDNKTQQTEIDENKSVSIEEEIKKTKKKEINFKTKDSWLIYGDIYYSKTKDPQKAIVLLHQLGSDRNDYASLIPPLQEAFPEYDIIALDLRGHGKSTNLGSYSNFGSGDYKAMKNDVEGLKTYLGVERPTIKEFYLVGSSIGSSVALDYAANSGFVKKVIMISPGIAYKNYNIKEAAKDYMYGLYLVAAEEDDYSAQSAEEIYHLSPSDSKVLKIYYNMGAHGMELSEKTKNESEPLNTLIIKWIGKN